MDEAEQNIIDYIDDELLNFNKTEQLLLLNRIASYYDLSIESLEDEVA